MAAEQTVQTAGELLAGAAQTFADLEEQTAALVFLVLHIQGQGQTVLQFGAEFVQLHIFHALQPATEIIHEGVHFGSGRIQRAQQEAQTLPELVPGFLHTFQHDAQPDGKARLGFAQAQDHGLGQSRIQTAGLQRGRGGTFCRGSRRGSGSGGKGHIGHGLGDGLVMFRRGGSGALRTFFLFGQRLLHRAFAGSVHVFGMRSVGFDDVDVVGTIFFGSLPLFDRGSFFGISRPGRIFVTAEDALPPAATGRRRFGLFFRFFAGVVTGLFHGIRSGFGSFFRHSVIGSGRGDGGRLATSIISRLGNAGLRRFLGQRPFFRFPGSFRNGLDLGSHSFRFRLGLFLPGKDVFLGVRGSGLVLGRLFAGFGGSVFHARSRVHADVILFGRIRFHSGITGSFFRRHRLGSRFRRGHLVRRDFIFRNSSRDFFFGDSFALRLHGGLVLSCRGLGFRHGRLFHHASGFRRSFRCRRLVGRLSIHHDGFGAVALFRSLGSRSASVSAGLFLRRLVSLRGGFRFRLHLPGFPGNGSAPVFRGLVRRGVFSRGSGFFSRRDGRRFRRAFRFGCAASGVSGRRLRGHGSYGRFLLDCCGLRFFGFLGTPTKKLFYCGKKAHSLSLFHCGPAQGLQNFFKISRTGLHGQRTLLTAGILQRTEHLAGAVFKADSSQTGRCGKQHPP